MGVLMGQRSSAAVHQDSRYCDSESGMVVTGIAGRPRKTRITRKESQMVCAAITMKWS
jgi:hypothetical protein